MIQVLTIALLFAGAVCAEEPRKAAKMFTVDYQWMAQYTALEAKWNYTIPDDKEIRFENGRYVVPVMVYRHYQDMVDASIRE